jgi:hypothetical protein
MYQRPAAESGNSRQGMSALRQGRWATLLRKLLVVRSITSFAASYVLFCTQTVMSVTFDGDIQFWVVFLLESDVDFR